MNENTVIKTYWEGALSNLEILSIKSFIANGHKIFIYTYDNNLKSFDENMVVLDASDILPKKKRIEIEGIPTVFSNFFRFYLLEKTGGWWTDLDIVLLKPITTDSPLVFSLHLGADYYCTGINAAPLKVPKNHAIAKALIEAAESLSPEDRKQGMGSKLVTREVYRLKLDDYIVPPEIYSPLGWAEAYRVTEPNFGFDKITENTVAVHLFNYLWSYGKKIDKNGKYHPDSLYEKLKKKYDVS
jgi:hypothetical protein